MKFEAVPLVQFKVKISDICKYETEISYIVTKYIVCNSAHLFVVTHHKAGSQAISMWHRNIL